MSHMILELQAALENVHGLMSKVGVPAVSDEGIPLSAANRVEMVLSKVDELQKALGNATQTVDLLRDAVEFNGFDIEEQLKDALERKQAEQAKSVN